MRDHNLVKEMNRSVVKRANSIATELANRGTFSFIGFKTILAWHYLILFSPLLIWAGTEQDLDFLYARQICLYLSLALGFGIAALLDRFLRKRKTRRVAYAILALTGICAFASCALGILFLSRENLVLRLVFCSLTALSQTFLMHFWLNFKLNAAGDRIQRSFPVDMIYACLIAFLCCVLRAPYSYLVVTALPIVATASLLIKWKTERFPYEPATKQGQSPLADASKDGIIRAFLITLLPSMTFAFVFALLQGGFFNEGLAFMIAVNPLVMLGILVCGVMLLVLPKKPGGAIEFDLMHRLAMLLFVLGILGLSFSLSELTVACELAILAGFNLFDFGCMLLCISMIKSLAQQSAGIISGGRVLTYLGMSAGLVLGFAVMRSLPEAPSAILYSIGVFAIALLMITTLTPFRRFEAFNDLIKEKLEAKEGKASQLSREVPFPTLPPRPAEKAVPPVKKTMIEVPAPSTPQQRLEARQSERPELFLPLWKQSCYEVARLYRLSPREAEIFLLIAKGRNAEYVQQKLFISTHTVKTHIANIYHKLGVHSSQEMLSLIELFKEQKREDGKK
ncbi:MAG: helix-turn-helix transcriptional regulator [Eggerthellaceae bacterium]|nr:helix-turn-helix transcriptional regulator [Eggerthellaceae bacterium]